MVADADALLTIFGNLLSNAIRYTPPGGKVAAACGADGAMLWFSVTDSGVGMAAETQARIFEKFFRAPDVKRSEPRGLGLGLSIVQRLVASHGGRLEVASELGKGSTFRVWLPRELQSSEEESGGTHDGSF
jgi:signal transduction histidine kinase